MGRLRTRDVLWLLPATMTAIGLAVAVGGFAYDLAFAGLPDQDPTPEMEARWRYHCGIASVIELSGLAALLSGFAGLAVVGVCSWMRLHAFSYLIVAVVGAGMFLIIAPGEWKESRCIFLAPYCRFEHGWPFVYMRRWNEYEVFISRPPWLERYGWNWASEKAWNPTNNGSFFSPLALAADLAIALAVIGLPTAAYEIWRRRRSSFWQWHLSDMAIAVSIAAVLCGWWSMHHVRWTREQEALQKLDAMDRAASAAWDAAFDAGQVPPITGCSVDTELQCPAWLQKLLGQGGVPQVCESVISLVIVTWPDAEYERAAPMLQLLPNLRELGIHDASDRDVLQLPDFRHLVELHLLSSATHPITDAAMAKIGRQTGLTQLTMRGATITDAGMEHLVGLRKLTHLELSGARISDVSVERLKAFENLTDLDLDSTDITDAAVPALSSMTNLSTLDVNRTRISADGLARLRKALPKSEFPQLSSLRNYDDTLP